MENIPKVLHFIESGGLYGAERVILNLSREMQSIGRYTPVVGCIVSNKDEQCDLYDAAIAQNLEALKLEIPNRKLLWALPATARRLKRENIALIHSHGYKPSVYGSVIRMMSGIDVMATCHLWFEPENAPFKTRLMMALEKRFYRSFPTVVAVSDPIRNVLIESGMPPDRSEVVENGVDMTVSRTDDSTLEALREEFGLSPGEFCLLNTARLTRQKDQRTLITAATELKRRGLRFRVLIVGQGPLESALKEQIRECGLEHEVILVGFRSDIPALLSMADMFILPSIDEGMPMSLLEAVAARVPVVSTAVGDIPKLIKHNESGVIVPAQEPQTLASAILSICDDPIEGKRLAEIAHERMASRYSQQAMGQHYHRIYQSLLQFGGKSVYS